MTDLKLHVFPVSLFRRGIRVLELRNNSHTQEAADVINTN